MSRVCIKGLRKNTSERELREAFSAHGEVTDVRIMRTSAGKSRQFAFVGFRSDAEADAARSYFNGAFLDSAKVTVESARKVGDHSGDKVGVPRSKHSKAPPAATAAAASDAKSGDEGVGATGVDGKGKAALPDQRLNKDRGSSDRSGAQGTSESNSRNKSSGQSAAGSAKDASSSKAAKEKADFLEAAKPRSKAHSWANDTATANDTDVAASAARGDRGTRKGAGGDSDDDDDDAYRNNSSGDSSADDSDSDVNDFTAAAKKGKGKGKGRGKDAGAANGDVKTAKGKAKDAASAPAGNSDLDYLKSKVVNFSDDDEDDDDEEEEEEEEEEDDEEEEEDSISGAGQESPSGNAEADDDEADGASSRDTGRLFVRNLPFSCQEEEILSLFQPFGQVDTVHIPLNKEKGVGGSRGYAFVQYLLPENAQAAQAALDGGSFQGRVLHVIFAKSARDDNALTQGLTDSHGKPLSEYQAKKEAARRAAAGKTDGWNASFVRSEAVVESIAQRYGIEATDILDTAEAGGELAVRMAVGEAKVIQENRDYFRSHGVNLGALESQDSGARAGDRSRTTLLIKNLPKDAESGDLEPLFAHYGALNSFLLPPSRTVALADFVEATEARAAFKGLAYRRYRHTPLYLEWAPIDILEAGSSKNGKADKNLAPAAAAAAAAAVAASKEKETERKREKDAMTAVVQAVKKDGGKGSSASSASSAFASGGMDVDDGNDTASYQTLFLKNLSFAVSESVLWDHLESLDCGRSRGLRTVSLPTKVVGNKTMSTGFGFAEYSSAAFAIAAMNRMQGSALEAHKMEVKLSDKRLTEHKQTGKAAAAGGGGGGGKNKSADPNNCKLVVRNVAFQATQSELRALFATFGSVKRVRIPKKMQGDHRGFAFVDFSTPQEASAAMGALTGTHFYGRRLVLEWAKEDVETLGQLRQRAETDTAAISHAQKKQRIDDSDARAANDHDYGN